MTNQHTTDKQAVPYHEEDMKQAPWYQLIFTKKMLICIFAGFGSGLPLFFILQLLPVWLLSYGLSIKTISAFALAQLPYTLKFLWAPLLDYFQIMPTLGRRRSWMVVTQTLLLVAVASYALLDPNVQLKWVVLLTLSVSFLSSTFDVAVDAFRREILSDNELGLGNSFHVNAYKAAGFVPGGLSLILSDHLPWSWVFVITAMFLLPTIIMALVVSEPEASKAAPKTLRNSVIEPFVEFFTRKGWKYAVTVMLFILLYKLGDSMATSMQSTFIMKMGFTRTDLGSITKSVGFASGLLGSLVAGIWMLKYGVNKALWVFGVLQTLAILAFVLLAHYGPFTVIDAPERLLLSIVIAAETFCMSLGMIAVVSFIARTTSPAYTATQFALFTSLTAVPRTFVNASTGLMIESLGWEMFFYACMLFAIPGLLMLPWVAPWRERKNNYN